MMFLDKAPGILDSIKKLKQRLLEIIEPDFGLLDQLLSLGVLTLEQLADVRSERTVSMRNDALLDLLTSEEQCDKFVTALQRTDQQHIINFIEQSGGLQYIIIFMSVVTYCRGRPRPVQKQRVKSLYADSWINTQRIWSRYRLPCTCSHTVELMNPERICCKLIFAPYDSLSLVVSCYESPNTATLGQNFLPLKIQDGRRRC